MSTSAQPHIAERTNGIPAEPPAEHPAEPPAEPVNSEIDKTNNMKSKPAAENLSNQQQTSSKPSKKHNQSKKQVVLPANDKTKDENESNEKAKKDANRNNNAGVHKDASATSSDRSKKDYTPATGGEPTTGSFRYWNNQQIQDGIKSGTVLQVIEGSHAAMFFIS